MKNLIIGFLIIFSLMLSSFNKVINGETPEDLLHGAWEEISWEFEKVNYVKDKKDLQITGVQKKEICNNLIIHNAEVWNFSIVDKSLKMGENKNSQETLKWNLKGRGHILELIGPQGKEEYQIAELNEDKLVLFMNLDLQIKGIVKMTFKKII